MEESNKHDIDKLIVTYNHHLRSHVTERKVISTLGRVANMGGSTREEHTHTHSLPRFGPSMRTDTLYFAWCFYPWWIWLMRGITMGSMRCYRESSLLEYMGLRAAQPLPYIHGED